MHGIRINTYKQRYETFHNTFRPLFPLVNGCTWLLDRPVFKIPDSWYDEGEHLQEQGTWISGPMAELGKMFPGFESPDTGYWVSYDNFFLKYAGIIEGDWTSIIGIPAETDPNQWIRDDEANSDNPAFLEKTAKFYFKCVDGAFWEFFCQSEELITTVKKHIDTFLNLSWEGLKLENSYGFNSPMPTEALGWRGLEDDTDV